VQLDAEYPNSWVYVHDFNFAALVDGKVAILNVAEDSRPYKGHVDAGQFASFLAAKSRSELYAAQTFMSRRTYGERIDAITIFDRKSLSPIGEIVLPPRRMQVVTHTNAFQMTPDESWGFVVNFTPASSVTVVDMEARQVLQEIPNPACTFVFPTGRRGFSSFCSDGALVTYQLDDEAKVANSTRSKAFIDIDADPLYMKNAVIDGVTYFPSFQGRIKPIDFRGEAPKLLESWELAPATLAAERWAPGGWQVIAGGDDGRLYVLMHRDASEGSHKYGGTEVWVHEAVSGKQLSRYRLKGFSSSIAVTSPDQGGKRYLVATNADQELDIYDAADGTHLRTLHVNASANPIVVTTR
jgi:methylamine dehydrogenase heavy chain